MYIRQSLFLDFKDLDQNQLKVIRLHADSNGWDFKEEDIIAIIQTTSKTERKKLFRKVELTEKTVSVFSNGTFINLITDEKGLDRILSTRLDGIQKVVEFQPIKIGNKTVKDSGFEMNAVFNGLGLSSARSQVSSYFIGIEKGACYDKVKSILIK